MGNVTGIAVSPDGKLLVLSSTRSLNVREVETFGSIMTVRKLAFQVFSPDSATMLASDETGAIQEVSVRDGTIKRKIRGATNAITSSPTFSPDGKYLALLGMSLADEVVDQSITPDMSGGIRIEHGGKVKVLKECHVIVVRWPTLEVLADEVVRANLTPYSITWFPDSSHLLITGQGAEYVRMTLGQPSSMAAHLVPFVYAFYKASTGDGHSSINGAFVVERERVLALGQSGLGYHTPWTEFFMFDASTGDRVWPKEADEVGRVAPPNYLDWPLVSVSAASTIAVFSPFRPNIYLLDSKTGVKRGVLEQPEVRGVAISPDGSRVFAADSERVITYTISDQSTPRVWRHSDVPIEQPVLSLAGDGRGVVSLRDSTLREFDARLGRIGRTLLTSQRPVHAIVSHDAGRLLVDSRDMIAWYKAVGDLKEGDAVGSLWGSLAISTNGRLLAYGNRTRGLTIMSLPEGKIVANSKAEGDIIRFLAFSPDDKVVASLRQWTDTVELWKASNGERIGELAAPGPGESKANLTFDGTVLTYSRDGKYLAADFWNGRGMALWEITKEGNGIISSRYLHHPGMSHCLTLAFSRGSDTLACGEEDGSVTLFQLAGGAVQRFQAYAGAVTTMHFVEDVDGEGLVTSSVDGTMSRFRVLHIKTAGPVSKMSPRLGSTPEHRGALQSTRNLREGNAFPTSYDESRAPSTS